MADLPWQKPRRGNIFDALGKPFDATKIPQRPQSRLEYALAYAALGWAVFPCQWIDDGKCSCGRLCDSPGKHPLTKHGVKDASADSEQIVEWWGKWPQANIAVACGDASGIIVMDIDPRNGGDETLEMLTDEHGPLPDTITAMTGGGGEHYIFQHQGGRFPNLKGIDFQGAGKYIIVEPSSHVSGGAYAWEGSSDPLEGVTAAPPPEWIAAMAEQETITAPASGDLTTEYADPQTVADLRSALNMLDADDRDTWIATGHRLKSLGAVGRELWMTWSQTSDKWQPKDARKWDEFKPSQTGYQAVFKAAQGNGWVNPLSGGIQAAIAPAPEPVQIEPFSLANLSGKPVKPREWLIDQWIPMRETTAIYADGGTGKTLLTQQLMTSVVTGQGFFGLDAIRGPVVAIYCEDEIDEIHRRQEAINRHYGTTYEQLADGHVLCRVGDDNLFMVFDRNGKGELTPFYHEVRALVERIRPVLLIVDTRTDVFGGNESDRNQANAFIKQTTTKLAKEFNLASVVCAHPSVAGMMTGTGTSGSTAWNGAVRSRTYLTRDEITHRITWELKKSNYGKTGESIEMFWHEGALIPYIDASGLMTNHEGRHDKLVLDFLYELARRGQNVSMSSNQSTYAPKEMMKIAKAKKIKISLRDLEDAMQRLFESRQITLKDGFGNTRGKTVLPADWSEKDA